MKKVFRNLKFVFILIISVIFYSCTSNETKKSKEKDYELVIVHTNDVHSRALEGKKEMGYAKINTVINNLKKDPNNKEVMFLDAGDTFHGTPFATLERGESIVKILDKMNLKAMTLGNHDYNYGQERVKEIQSEAKFNILASNVVYKNGEQFTKKYIIEEISGVKVGIFGLSTPETLYKTNPNNVKGLIFKDPILTAKEVVKELKAQDVKFIIVLAHLGLDESTKEEWRSTGIAKNVDGIDLIIDGHSHTELKDRILINDTSIVQTGNYGMNVGIVKVDFDKLKESGKKSDAITTELLSKKALDSTMDNNKKTETTDIEKYIQDIKTEQNKITSKIIGKTPVKLQGDRELVRATQTNLSNLVADSLVWKTNADMSMTNGGGIRASIEEGNITVGDVVNVLPFGNYAVTKELTGAQIKASLEEGFKDAPNAAGSYAQIGGITLNLDLTKPKGQRVSNIKFKNGKKFQIDKKYVVATNDFMAAGGDDYSEFKNGREIANYSGMDEILIQYISSISKISGAPDDRVKTKK
ncbi:MAG: bifunctional metallophosphatase/5'-nucleotidase [Fusobacteriaceae bacterium]